jgi:hypothetical protein
MQIKIRHIDLAVFGKAGRNANSLMTRSHIICQMKIFKVCTLAPCVFLVPSLLPVLVEAQCGPLLNLDAPSLVKPMTLDACDAAIEKVNRSDGTRLTIKLHDGVATQWQEATALSSDLARDILSATATFTEYAEVAKFQVQPCCIWNQRDLSRDIAGGGIVRMPHFH